MTALAVLLIAAGLADLGSRLTRRRWVPAVLGPVVVVGCAALAGLWRPGDIVLLTFAAAAVTAWVLLAARAARTGTGHLAPLAVFGSAVGLLIVLSGIDSPVGGVLHGWPAWAGIPVHPDRLLMIIGVTLLQIVTGNQLVRLVLGSVGAVKPEGQPQPSDRLKGGRLLGPMERLLILGLGLAGHLVAATAVIAAKSVIRFPEINAQKARENGDFGIDEVTEYFLVGSFASWIVALGGLALAQ
ncbi:putative membrane protein [Mycolicibacterium hassiacum DSM 44199]|jgi:hypothetical protein|uniref:Putative membrane protein n=1 Tax=Mycolicibacterium hassiacum (strain DSM 44199 / CIP 105218 / JCM 12690 / 3849) TaxID=1122247 RepID=K5BE97_MYCHD|nr:hypothetical protein [Mycolicibacterium hassiacum]EKF22126.1 putative membrane protein [Mycolicibacterium hassiacum DSM 44199]MBX5485227.1 hypothetical protein [Mycolicibacterium hassiacum]MDA4086570.1 membrane protein [Mycolicibacterium hassiacum DSM 44199]PZN21672.1 MAG: hypothetical protein DIU75_09570 [Mycolicibacterium hassiacum]VCT92027.1 hypothetical protein MHAS_03751 [Mycolicibacterium hassiacum DSM 44199]